MTNFARKIKRKRFNLARKQFMKDFKKSMANFKKQVVCSVCQRAPIPGENIDEWQINQESNNIDLICPNCFPVIKEEKDD